MLRAAQPPLQCQTVKFVQVSTWTATCSYSPDIGSTALALGHVALHRMHTQGRFSHLLMRQMQGSPTLSHSRLLQGSCGDAVRSRRRTAAGLRAASCRLVKAPPPAATSATDCAAAAIPAIASSREAVVLKAAVV